MENTKIKKFNKIIKEIFENQFDTKDNIGLPADWESTQRERLERGKTDREYFYKTYFPHICYRDFGDMHREWMSFNDLEKKIIAYPGPREFGKTVLNSLEVIREICYKLKSYIIFVSDDETTAAGRIENIKEEILNNKRLQSDFKFSVYGDAKERIINKTKLHAKGWRQQLKGMNWQGKRPEKAIIDDLYTGRDSVKIEEEKLERITGKLFPALNSDNGLILWIENMESKNSAIYYFKERCENETENENIICKIYKALDEKGESTWKKGAPTEKLLQLRETIGSIEFERQMQQNPIVKGKYFKEEWFENFFDPKDFPKMPLFCWSDPGGADHNKKKACMKSVNCIGLHEGRYYVFRVALDHMDLKTFVGYHYDFYEEFQHQIKDMAMEDNFYQSLLFRWFDEAAEEKYPLPIKGKSTKTNKWLDIESLVPLLERGKILFNKHDKKNVKKLQEQALQYEGEEKTVAPVDGLDALARGIKQITKSKKKSAKTKLFGGKKWKKWLTR